MIRRNELVPVGNVGKPHGLAGEMQMSVDSDVPLQSGSCLIMPVDGIFVPFFVETVRQKTPGSRLVKLVDIDSDRQAAGFNGTPLFMTIDHIDSLPEDESDDDDGLDDEDSGFYATSLIGSRIVDTDGTEIGTISDINATTANVLFDVERPDGSSVFIPVCDDFVVAYDSDTSVLTLDLPQGLIDSQS